MSLNKRHIVGTGDSGRSGGMLRELNQMSFHPVRMLSSK